MFGVALVSLWLLDNLIHDIWDAFREPNDTYVTMIAAVVSISGTIWAYKNPKYYKFVKIIDCTSKQFTMGKRAATSAERMRRPRLLHCSTLHQRLDASRVLAEHHDFPEVPNYLLPRLRRIAPEFYDSLEA